MSGKRNCITVRGLHGAGSILATSSRNWASMIGETPARPDEGAFLSKSSGLLAIDGRKGYDAKDV